MHTKNTICVNARCCIRANIRAFCAKFNHCILKIDYHKVKFHVSFINTNQYVYCTIDYICK
jgi:hypothetical protein